MKLKLFITVLLISVIPSVTHASWWNSNTWFGNSNEISNNKNTEAVKNTETNVKVTSNIQNSAELELYKNKVKSLEYENKILKDQVKTLQSNLADLTNKYNKLLNSPVPKVDSEVKIIDNTTSTKIDLILRDNVVSKPIELKLDTDSPKKVDILGFSILPSTSGQFNINSIDLSITGNIDIAYLVRDSMTISSSVVKDGKVSFILNKNDYYSIINNIDNNIFRVLVDAKPSVIQAKINSVRVMNQNNTIESTGKVLGNIIKITSVFNTDKKTCESKGGVWFNTVNYISNCTVSPK